MLNTKDAHGNDAGFTHRDVLHERSMIKFLEKRPKAKDGYPRGAKLTTIAKHLGLNTNDETLRRLYRVCTFSDMVTTLVGNQSLYPRFKATINIRVLPREMVERERNRKQAKENAEKKIETFFMSQGGEVRWDHGDWRIGRCKFNVFFDEQTLGYELHFYGEQVKKVEFKSNHLDQIMEAARKAEALDHELAQLAINAPPIGN